MAMALGVEAKLRAIDGSAVAITVPSRFSMKKAPGDKQGDGR